MFFSGQSPPQAYLITQIFENRCYEQAKTNHDLDIAIIYSATEVLLATFQETTKGRVNLVKFGFTLWTQKFLLHFSMWVVKTVFHSTKATGLRPFLSYVCYFTLANVKHVQFHQVQLLVLYYAFSQSQTTQSETWTFKKWQKFRRKNRRTYNVCKLLRKANLCVYVCVCKGTILIIT